MFNGSFKITVISGKTTLIRGNHRQSCASRVHPAMQLQTADGHGANRAVERPTIARVWKDNWHESYDAGLVADGNELRLPFKVIAAGAG